MLGSSYVDTVRKAYKKRALATHPDRNPNVPKVTAEEGFRAVSNAYEVLNDPEKRKVCPPAL
jgi:curved DNA-binding protein CbpA